MADSNEWVEAKVVDITDENSTIKTYTFKTPRPFQNKAGQHYELRLTAEDGYQAARLYSAASTTDPLKLTIQLVPNGEMTPYIHDILAVGDSVEIRGPFGRFFVWDESVQTPVLLIGGGSGIAPLATILQAHMQVKSDTPIHMLYSARTFDDILYKDVLVDNPNVTITLTAETPDDWQGKQGRISQSLLQELLQQFPEFPVVYVCGMSPFVSAVNDALQELGVPATLIKTERFG